MLGTFIFQETSPAAAGTVASSQPVSDTESYSPNGVAASSDLQSGVELVDFCAELVGAAGGTLDVYVQGSYASQGADWFDLVHFAQLAAGASAVIYRAKCTSHPQATSDAPVAIGKNLAPALAAAIALQTLGFNCLRLVMVAGSGTTAGAAVKVTATIQRPDSPR
jgi:hypothetical protein